MASRKTHMIQLSKIVNKFDVRTKLDEDRVVQFATMYESPECTVPPVHLVQLNEDSYAYVDGRHRGAARAYLNLPDVEAVISNGELLSDPAELYSTALRSNWGGSKPPSRDDIAHTIIAMMEAGVRHKTIKEKIDFITPKSMEMYITWAKGVIYKRRITRARSEIASGGMTVEEASRRYQLKLENLKDVIAGKKRKWGKDTPDEKYVVNEHKIYISKALGAANKGIGKKVEILLGSLSDGEISAKAVEAVVTAWEKHIYRTSVRIEDWKARVLAVATGQKAPPMPLEDNSEE